MKGVIGMGLWLTAALLATVCGGGSAPTPTPLPTIGPPPAPPGAAELADRYYAALNSGNVGQMMAILDPDVVMSEGDSQIVGKADVVARHIAALTSLADYAFLDAVTEGNSFRATHTYKVDPSREAGDFPLTSAQIEIVVQDGRITFLNVVTDFGADVRQDPRPTPSPTAEAATPTAAPATKTAAEEEDIEEIRRLAFDYWTAFNDYDKDTVLSYLEESYRAEREDKIGKDIGRLKLFRVTLGVSQLTPPRLTGVGEAEMMLSMKEPVGTRQIRMAFRKVDGEWKITHAEEVK